MSLKFARIKTLSLMLLSFVLLLSLVNSYASALSIDNLTNQLEPVLAPVQQVISSLNLNSDTSQSQPMTVETQTAATSPATSTPAAAPSTNSTFSTPANNTITSSKAPEMASSSSLQPTTVLSSTSAPGSIIETKAASQPTTIYNSKKLSSNKTKYLYIASAVLAVVAVGMMVFGYVPKHSKIVKQHVNGYRFLR